MGVLDDNLAVNVRKPRPKHPAGWEPGMVFDGERGVVISEPQLEPVNPDDFDFAHVIRFFGYDPEQYETDGMVEHRAWQTTIEGVPTFLFYYKCKIRKRGAGETEIVVAALLERVRRRKTRKAPVVSTSGAGLVVAMGDWQVGKSDGDGVQGTIDRLAAIPELIERRWRGLRSIGVPLEVVYLCFGGDLKESCSGHYAQQGFRTALNNREQRDIVLESADRIIDHALSYAPRVEVKVVGGNHGEEREGGKSHTDFADNVDVAVIADVSRIYARNPERYPKDRITFAIPWDDLTLTFEHEGTVIGLAHGHQAGFGSGDPQAKIHKWWLGMQHGRQPIGDADILVTFHYHHPWMIRRGARTHFGSPALDGGSDWFRNTSGQDAPPSTLSFVVDAGGWSHMELLK
jgi:hypothetical protein